MKFAERVTRLETVIPAIHDELKRLNGMMEGMDHIIRGNGSPGLAAKVESLTSAQRRYRDLLFTVVGGIAVGITVSIFSSWSTRHAQQPNMPEMQQKP